MSNLNRGVKTSEGEERLRPGKLLKKRGSFDLTEKSSLLLSPSITFKDQFPPFTNANKFFSSTKVSDAGSIRKSQKSSISKYLPSSQEHLRNDNCKFWEITERIESLEIRMSQSSEADPKSKFKIWKNCISEVLFLVKKENIELGNIVQRLIKGFHQNLDEICYMHTAELSDYKQIIQQHLSTISLKTEEIKSLNEKITTLNEFKFKEQSKINKEIEDIFGDFDVDQEEIRNAKERCLKLSKDKADSLVPILREIFESLKKGRDHQDFSESEIDQPHPDDIAKALQFNFSLILQASTKKAMNLLKKDVKTKLVSTQTLIACVSVEEYNELMGKLEKSIISQQNLTVQIEKYREELLLKIQAAEKAETEKTQAISMMSKMKKEIEVYLKELAIVKKDNEKINIEKDKTEKQLDVKTEQLIKVQNKLASTENKLQKLNSRLAQDGQYLAKDEDAPGEIKRRPSEREISANLTEGHRGSTFRPRQNMGSRKNSRSYIEGYGKPNYTGNHLTKKPEVQASSSRTSLVEDYIDYINQPAKARKSEIVAVKKRSSIYPAENSPSHSRATDTEHKADITEKIKLDSSHAKKKSIQINIIRPEEASQLEEEEEKKIASNEKLSKTKQNKTSLKKSTKSNTKSLQKPNASEEKFEESPSEVVEIERVIQRDGKALIICDKSTITIDKMTTFCSVATQYGEEDSEDFQDTLNHKVFHFNPNNFFGFKGDVFFNAKTFTAQPKMPENPMILGKKD